MSDSRPPLPTTPPVLDISPALLKKTVDKLNLLFMALGDGNHVEAATIDIMKHQGIPLNETQITISRDKLDKMGVDSLIVDDLSKLQNTAGLGTGQSGTSEEIRLSLRDITPEKLDHFGELIDHLTDNIQQQKIEALTTLLNRRNEGHPEKSLKALGELAAGLDMKGYENGKRHLLRQIELAQEPMIPTQRK